MITQDQYHSTLYSLVPQLPPQIPLQIQTQRAVKSPLSLAPLNKLFLTNLLKVNGVGS
ncbi:hypothetical protein Godav_017415 [Gossypium davidsonii]|uniref:Uncharacterized protein n=2 Tax=Gossypium TaxID=3633 RepID=A0A7J8QT77_GOSDV|nr:hypothetical protein [Gossypium davidsonii]MBA0639669.1 hypothetical protein [Gossypium klotzschianum]